MTSKQLNEENSVKVDNTYKLLKKYIAVKQIIHTLGVSQFLPLQGTFTLHPQEGRCGDAVNQFDFGVKI